MESFDVAIFGGGCGGLWTLHEVLRRGYRGVLFEEHPLLASFASTRGQNRLHSGAMYAVASPNSPSAFFRACRSGYQDLIEFCKREVPSGLSIPSRGVYIYKTQKDRDDILQQSQMLGATYGISLSPFGSGDFSRMGLRTVARIAPDYLYGIESDEYSFRPHIILRRLLQIIKAADGEIRNITPGSLSLLKRSGDRWSIHTQNGEVCAPIVVFASGVAAVEQFAAISGRRPNINIDISPIVVVHRQLSRRFVSFQQNDFTDFIAMAPYGSACTLTFGKNIHRSITHASDTSFDFERIHSARLWPAISADLPHLVKSGGEKWHFYACQKLSNFEASSKPLSRFGARHYFWVSSPSAPGAYLYCPGKWTFSRLAADEFVTTILGSSNHTNPLTPRRQSRSILLPIASPPAFQKATYRVANDGTLGQPWLAKVRSWLGGVDRPA